METTVVSLSSKEMDTANRIQILDESFSISHTAATLGKGMLPTILLLVISK